MHLTQAGDVLFVALGDHFAFAGSAAGLVAIDIADPRNPSLLDDYYAVGAACGSATVIERNGVVYLSVFGQGLEALAFANDTFSPLDTIVPGGTSSCGFGEPQVRGMALQGDRLYVGNDGGGMAIIDVSIPTALIEIETYRNPLFGAKLYPYNHLAIDGDIVYAAVDYCGVETINVGDEGHLVQEDWWNPWGCELLSNWWLGSPGHANQIELDLANQRAIVSAGDSEVLVLDISDPSQLRLIGQVGQPGNGEGVWGAHLADGIVYATYIENVIPFASSVSALRAYAVPEPRFSVLAVAGVLMLALLNRTASRHP